MAYSLTLIGVKIQASRGGAQSDVPRRWTMLPSTIISELFVDSGMLMACSKLFTRSWAQAATRGSRIGDLAKALKRISHSGPFPVYSAGTSPRFPARKLS